MLLHHQNVLQTSPKDKLREFDNTLRTLRRQFRRLLKELRTDKNCKQVIDISEGDSSGISKKTNDSVEELPCIQKSNSEDKIDNSDLNKTPVKESDIDTKKLLSNNFIAPKIIETNFTQDEISEILSVQFDTISEQSMLQQFQQSKLTSNQSKNELQKSPVPSGSKIKEKINKSPKLNVISEKVEIIIEEDELREIPKSAPDSVNSTFSVNKSLFSCIKEKENPIISLPKSKPSQKLGISNLYNVDTKLLSNGNKLKQTKLVFLPEEKKTDISKLSNFNNEADKSGVDSLFDSTLFNCNSSIEKMDIDTDEVPLSIVKSNVNLTTKRVASTPKKLHTLKKDDYDKMSPPKENKNLKYKNKVEVKKNDTADSEHSEYMSLKSDSNIFNPQACSTQISSKKEDTINKNAKYYPSSDSDTDFSFLDEHSFRKKTCPSAKKTCGDVTNRVPRFKPKSNKDCVQSKQIEVSENMMDDETFFSPGECQRDLRNEEPAKPSTSGETANTLKTKRILFTKTDEIPEKKKRSPDYPYVEHPVRKKCERAQLAGWSCWDCKKYYQNLQLPEKELQECLKKCSRHKAKFDPEYHTPPNFWDPAFSDTFAPTLCVLGKKSNS